MDIHQAIPHRPPFLFLDAITHVDDAHVVATRTVRADEPQFEGHYPGNPIMPGVLLCEAVFQAGAVYMAHRFGNGQGTGAGTPILARVENARFKQIVKPGDELTIEARFKESISRFHFMEGSIKRADKAVMSVGFAFTLVTE